MAELLKAQAYVAGANLAQININTEERAPDGGADAITPQPQRDDDWLGNRPTCWQFKSGTAGRAACLKGEVLKDVPRQTLLNGGRYVVVCSASNSGDKGLQERKKVLLEEARASGIPTDYIEVIGSELLTTWCNKHPAIAAVHAGRPSGLWRLSDWEASEEHNVGWVSTQDQRENIARLRLELDLRSGTAHHVHVFGHPGVGKSRFALELCRGASWAPFVIYIRRAQEVRLSELIDSCVSDAGVQLVIVADDVTLDHLLPLRSSIGRANDRLRLISIGTCTSPDIARIQPIEVQPLPVHEVPKVIQRWYPGMPIEHAQFAAEFSAGYLRLAKLAADAVRRHPRMNMRTMLEQHDVKLVLDAMLGSEDRGSLHVVAALTSIGWEDEEEPDGRAVAEKLGFDWAKVRLDVDRFHGRFQIAPLGGRLRYISPRPLGIYLALEVWRVYKSQMRSLPEVLSIAGVDAYYDRLQDLASSPQASDFAREQLDAFFPMADLNDVRTIRRWFALSFADPGMAVSHMHAELKRRKREERAAIQGDSRRWLIYTFVGLSWSAQTFYDAAHSLALLAEADINPNSNPAADEFMHRFSLLLSGTAMAYTERLHVLQELLASGDIQLRQLAVRALGELSKNRGYRNHRRPIVLGIPEEEWQPKNRQEYVESYASGVAMLHGVVEMADCSLSAVIGEVIPDFAQRVFDDAIHQSIPALLLTTAEKFPEHRDAIRQRIAARLKHARKYSKNLDSKLLSSVEGLLANFREDTPVGRLLEFVGPASSSGEEAKIQALASEFAANIELIRSQWAWLTSGEAKHAWIFGRCLGTHDLDVLMSELIVTASMGLDCRVVCGYLERRAADCGEKWLDGWLDDFDVAAKDRGDFILEATWRLTPTERGAFRIRRILDERRASVEAVNQLAYGQWAERLTYDVLKMVLEALADYQAGARPAASILQARLSTNREELECWSPLALRICKAGEFIRDRRDNGYDWVELANLLVERYPGEILSALLAQQNLRDNDSWFLEHSLANDVAWACVRNDPVGAWEIVKPYLEQDEMSARRFVVGFPEGLLDTMNHTAIQRWVAVDPASRASLLAEVVSMSLEDSSLSAVLINSYSHIEDVSTAFYSRAVSGSWSGPASAHRAGQANHMRTVAKASSLPGLRKWILKVAGDLDHMSAQYRIREEERDLRR